MPTINQTARPVRSTLSTSAISFEHKTVSPGSAPATAAIGFNEKNLLEDAYLDSYVLPTTIGFELEANCSLLPSNKLRSTDHGCELGHDHCGHEFRSQVFSTWGDLRRALRLADAMQAAGVRNFAHCGMHIHVGLKNLCPDPDTLMKFLACVRLSRDYFTSQVSALRWFNGYCQMCSPQDSHDYASFVRDMLVPILLGGTSAFAGEAALYYPYASRPIGFMGSSVVTLPEDPVKAIMGLLLLEGCAVKYKAEPRAGECPVIERRIGEGECWMRMNGHGTAEFRLFDPSNDRISITHNLLTVIRFVEAFKKNPDVFLRGLAAAHLAAVREREYELSAFKTINLWTKRVTPVDYRLACAQFKLMPDFEKPAVTDAHRHIFALRNHSLGERITVAQEELMKFVDRNGYPAMMLDSSVRLYSNWGSNWASGRMQEAFGASTR